MPNTPKLNIRMKTNETIDNIRKRAAFAISARRAHKTTIKGVHGIIRTYPAAKIENVRVESWSVSISYTIYLTAKNIPSTLTPIFERLERFDFALDDWKSTVSQNYGTLIFSNATARIYKGENFTLELFLVVSPDESAAGEGTCRRVLVGEAISTIRIPKYDVRCD
jgi:hypothetical protein